jgi:DNA repair ATPase RecN
LFKALKNNRTLTSHKDNNFIKISNHLFKQKYIKSSKIEPSTLKSNFTVLFPPTVKNIEKSIKISQETHEDTENSTNLQKIQEEIKKLQSTIQEKSRNLKDIRLNLQNIESISQNLESEIQKITLERDKYKESYSNYMKTKLENKIIEDSQKKLIKKYTFITEQTNSRPSTGIQRSHIGQSRPLTAAGPRRSLARLQFQ